MLGPCHRFDVACREVDSLDEQTPVRIVSISCTGTTRKPPERDGGEEGGDFELIEEGTEARWLRIRSCGVEAEVEVGDGGYGFLSFRGRKQRWETKGFWFLGGDSEGAERPFEEAFLQLFGFCERIRWGGRERWSLGHEGNNTDLLLCCGQRYGLLCWTGRGAGYGNTQEVGDQGHVGCEVINQRVSYREHRIAETGRERQMRRQDLVVFFSMSTGLRKKTFRDDESERELVGLASFEHIAFWQKRSL